MSGIITALSPMSTVFLPREPRLGVGEDAARWNWI
jgi:hypothetical protein